MTAKLDFALMFRDEQVAEEVRKKAELGWLDVEFTVYGTCYCQDNNMYYMVSTEEKDIYAFIESAALKNIFCSDVLSYSEKCSVPIGTKEDKELEIKKKLARQMRAVYPKSLFQILNNVANTLRNDNAKVTLDRLKAEVEGVFDEEKLRYFEMLVDYCYSNLNLSYETFQNYKKWLSEERSYMEDDFIQKDQFEKTYYGFAYETAAVSTGFKYVEDSLLEYVLKKKSEYYKKGILTGAIYTKTVYYNYSKSPIQLRKAFLEELKKVMSLEYWEMIKILNKKKNLELSHIDQIQAMSPEAQATYEMYLGKWRVK